MYIGCKFENNEKNHLTSNILSFNYTEAEGSNPMPSIPHSHSHTEIMIVYDGVGELLINNKKIPFDKGKLYVINPNTEHAEFQKSNLKYFVIKIKDFALDAAAEAPQYKAFNLSSKESADIFETLLSVVTELRSYLPYKEEIAREILTGAYYKFLRIIESRNHSIKNEIEKFISSNMKEAINYIEGNFTKAINLSEVAERFSISHNTLIRLFHKHTALSPKQFILEKRISVAKEELINTDHSASHIATICGFSDAAYFTKQFKIHTGMTPSDYRRTKKQERLVSSKNI